MPVTPNTEDSKLQPLRRTVKSRSGPVHGKVSMYYSDTGTISVKSNDHVWKRDPNRLVPTLPRINKDGYQSTFTSTDLGKEGENMTVSVVQKYKLPVGVAKPTIDRESDLMNNAFEKTTPWLPPPSSLIPLPLPKQLHTYMTEGSEKTARGGGYGSVNPHAIFSGVSSGVVAAQITQSLRHRPEDKECTEKRPLVKASKPFLNTLPKDYPMDSSKVQRIDNLKRQASVILSKHQSVLLEPIKRNYLGDLLSLHRKEAPVKTKKTKTAIDLTTVDVADYSHVQSEYSFTVFAAHANTLRCIADTQSTSSHIVDKLPESVTRPSKYAATHRVHVITWLFPGCSRTLHISQSSKQAGKNTGLQSPVSGRELRLQYPMLDFSNHLDGVPVTSEDLDDLLDLLPDGELLVRVFLVLQRQSWRASGCVELKQLVKTHVQSVYDQIPRYRASAVEQGLIDAQSMAAFSNKQWQYCALHLPMEHDEVISYLEQLAGTSARFTSIFALAQALAGQFSLRTSQQHVHSSLLPHVGAADTDEGLQFTILRHFRFPQLSAIESEANRRKTLLGQRGVNISGVMLPRSLVFSLDMLRQVLKVVRSQDDMEEPCILEGAVIPCNDELTGLLSDKEMVPYDGGPLHTFSTVWNIFHAESSEDSTQFIPLQSSVKTSSAAIHSRLVYMVKLLLKSAPFNSTVIHRYEDQLPFLTDQSLDYASIFVDLLTATVLILRDLVASMQFYFSRQRYSSTGQHEQPRTPASNLVCLHAVDYIGAGVYGVVALVDYLDVCARKATYSPKHTSLNPLVPIYYEGGCYVSDHNQQNLSLTFGYEEKTLLDARSSPALQYTHTADDTLIDIVKEAKKHYQYIVTATSEKNGALYGMFGNGLRACTSFEHILGSLAKDMPLTRAPPTTPYLDKRVKDPTNEHFYVLQKNIPLGMLELCALQSRVNSAYLSKYLVLPPSLPPHKRGLKIQPTAELSILDQAEISLYGLCNPFHVACSQSYASDVNVRTDIVSLLKDVEWTLEYLPQQASKSMFSRIVKILKMRRYQSRYQIVTALGQRAQKEEQDQDHTSQELQDSEQDNEDSAKSSHKKEELPKSPIEPIYSLPKLNVTKYNVLTVSNPPSPLAPAKPTPALDLQPIQSSVDFFADALPQAPSKKAPSKPPTSTQTVETGSPNKQAPRPPTK